VLLDFPFSFPYGTATAWGAGESWHDLVHFIASRYKVADRAKPARTVAECLNADRGDAFRFDGDRCSKDWYLGHGVAYFRATELAVSEALSEFYAGAGAQVALGTLSGLNCLAGLFRKREPRETVFKVWPFEATSGEGSQHILAESYPALFPPADIDETEHRRDARRMVLAARAALADGTLRNWFQVPAVPFGRYAGVSFEEQIRFEGWIAGVHSGRRG
jgi:hypothetical protein